MDKKELFKLDFNYPYEDFLMMYGVPREKWNEFFAQFGEYMHSISTPEKEKGRAFLWMITNGDNNKVRDMLNGFKNQ
jgi:hypothetical protein